MSHATNPGTEFQRYIPGEPTVTEETIVSNEVVHHQRPGLIILDRITFPPGASTGCEIQIFEPGATIWVYSTHNEAAELRGPRDARLRQRVAQLQFDGYCQNLKPAGPAFGGPLHIEGEPPVIGGEALPPR